MTKEEREMLHGSHAGQDLPTYANYSISREGLPPLPDSAFEPPENACYYCGELLSIGSWPFCRSRTNPDGHGNIQRHDAVPHESEKTVLWEHPVHGTRWPGRNDAPMPAHYAKMGFQPVEYRGARAHMALEKKHGVISETLNYNRGSGHE